MKIDIKHFALAAAGATMLLTSCIGDLDTLPLNPSDSTSETVYGKDENGYLAGLTKLYFNFVSNDTTDLQVSDGGASELIRAFWTIQEVTADACKCAWENDAWVRAMNTDTWSDADNDATYAVYVRTLQGIAYVNEQRTGRQDPELPCRGPFPARLFLLDRPRRVRRRAVYDRDLALRRRCEPQTGLAQGCL